MKIERRQLLQLAAGAAALPALSRVASAQAYPTRPITMIVSFAAGGPADAVGRTIVERIRTSLGQPVVVENVTGADGSIAAGRAARAKHDGYTIDLGSISTHVLNPAFYSLPYDVLKDFAPVSPLVTTANFLFARKTMAATGLQELIASLKAKPDHASMGVGNVSYRLLAALFKKETGSQ
jgi:tripartite-type tricarboxylate transporter receptor subunit TctC